MRSARDTSESSLDLMVLVANIYGIIKHSMHYKRIILIESLFQVNDFIWEEIHGSGLETASLRTASARCTHAPPVLYLLLLSFLLAQASE